MKWTEKIDRGDNFCLLSSLKRTLIWTSLLLALTGSPHLMAQEQDLLPQTQDSLATFSGFLYADFVKKTLDEAPSEEIRNELKSSFSQILSQDMDQFLSDYAIQYDLFHDQPEYQVFSENISQFIPQIYDEIELQKSRKKTLLTETGKDEIDFSRYEAGLMGLTQDDSSYFQTVNRIYPEMKHTVAFSLIQYLKTIDYPHMIKPFEDLLRQNEISDETLYDLALHVQAANYEKESMNGRDEIVRNSEESPWSHWVGNPVSPGLVITGNICAAGSIICISMGLIAGGPLLIETGKAGVLYSIQFLKTWFRGILALRKIDLAIFAVIAITYETAIRLDDANHGILTQGNFIFNSGKHFLSLVLLAGGLKALPSILQQYLPAITIPIMGKVAIHHYQQKNYYQTGLAVAFAATSTYQGLKTIQSYLRPLTITSDTPRLIRMKFRFPPPEENDFLTEPSEPPGSYDIYGDALKALNHYVETHHELPVMVSPALQVSSDTKTMASLTQELQSTTMTLTLGHIEVTYDPLPIDLTRTLLPYVMDPGVSPPSHDKHRALIARTEQDDDGNTHIIGLEFQDVTSTQLNYYLTHPNFSVMGFYMDSPSSPVGIQAKKKNGTSSSTTSRSAPSLEDEDLDAEFMKLKQNIRDEITRIYLKHEIPVIDLISALKQVRAELHYPSSLALEMIEDALRQGTPIEEVFGFLKNREESLREGSEWSQITEEYLQSQEGNLPEVFPSALPLSTSMLRKIDVNALNVTEEFRHEADQVIGPQIDVLVDRFDISRTSIYVALNGLVDHLGLSYENAILDLEQFLAAKETSTEVSIEESVKEEIQFLMPQENDSSGKINIGYRFQPSRTRQFLRPETIPPDKMRAINTFIKAHEQFPFRDRAQNKDEEIFAETILDHGGYAAVFPYLWEDNQKLPKVRAYFDINAAAHLLDVYVAKARSLPLQPKTITPKDETQQLYWIMQYHGGKEKIYPHLSSASQKILTEEMWTKPMAQVNTVIAQIQDWPNKKQYPELARFIGQHGRAKIYDDLTPENQALFSIQRSMVPMDLINEWLTTHQKLPRFLQKEFEARRLTEEERQERSIYIAIYIDRGGISAIYDQLSPENQQNFWIRLKAEPYKLLKEWILEHKRWPYIWVEDLEEHALALLAPTQEEQRKIFPIILLHYNNLPLNPADVNPVLVQKTDLWINEHNAWPSVTSENHSEVLLAKQIAQQGGRLSIYPVLSGENKIKIHIRFATDAMGILEEWILENKRFPSQLSQDPIERNLAEWHSNDIRSRSIIFSLLRPDCQNIFDIAIHAGLPGIVHLTNQFIEMYERFPEELKHDRLNSPNNSDQRLKEHLLATAIYRNGGRTVIYPLLKPKNRQRFKVKLAADPISLINERLITVQRCLKFSKTQAKDDTLSKEQLEEELLSRWIQRHGGYAAIYSKLSLEAQSILDVRMRVHPTLAIEEWFLTEKRKPTRSKTASPSELKLTNFIRHNKASNGQSGWTNWSKDLSPTCQKILNGEEVPEEEIQQELDRIQKQ